MSRRRARLAFSLVVAAVSRATYFAGSSASPSALAPLKYRAEDMRLWLRIESPGLDHVLPEPLIIAEETTMRELADGLRLPAPDQWHAMISPAAVADGDGVRMDSELTLGALGAVPGATLTLRRVGVPSLDQ